MMTERGEIKFEAFSSTKLYRDCYQPLVGLADNLLLNKFYSEILPEMDKRSRSGRSLTQHEIMVKLWDKPKGKQGEAREILQAMKKTDENISPDLLSEVADLVYYTANPNCPPSFRDSLYLFLPNINMWEGLRACNAKYSGRIKYGDEPNIKEVERDALALLIKDMQKNNLELILESTQTSNKINLYRLWLKGKPNAKIILAVDSMKVFWPF